MNPLNGKRGPVTPWKGWDDAFAGGPVRKLTTDRIKITGRGVSVVKRTPDDSGLTRPTRIMVQSCGGLHAESCVAAAEDFNFYSHELREYVRYRRLGWPTGVPRRFRVRDEVYGDMRIAHARRLWIPLRRDDLLYHPDSLPFIGEVP